MYIVFNLIMTEGPYYQIMYLYCKPCTFGQLSGSIKFSNWYIKKTKAYPHLMPEIFPDTDPET